MKLKFILPYTTIFDKEVKKITAPGSDGDFQILPRHIDGTWTLRAGVLNIEADRDLYFAINRGVVVKKGDTVYLSTIQAIAGDSLEELSKTVEETLAVLDEKERKAREVLIRLELETTKRFMEIEV
jgi:F-type H+-transporting ATPase subunit epsilon